MSETKICPQCKKELPATNEYFYIHWKNGVQGYCKKCTRNYYKENRDKFYNNQLKRKYGITLEDYNKMFIEQDGYCKICGRHQTEFKRRLSVDHNHKTGEVRGLLCDNCNTGLGILENEDFVIKAKKYLVNQNDTQKTFINKILGDMQL